MAIAQKQFIGFSQNSFNKKKPNIYAIFPLIIYLPVSVGKKIFLWVLKAMFYCFLDFPVVGKSFSNTLNTWLFASSGEENDSAT